jgi:DNA-binding ferritin-like protein (Dps family)
MAKKNLLELVVGSLDDKKRWKQYKARVRALPDGYRESAQAVERYLMHLGTVPSDGARLLAMFDDLAVLFEQAAADGTPVRDIVGEDPVDFVTEFMSNYADGTWIDREQARLKKSMDDAAGAS